MSMKEKKIRNIVGVVLLVFVIIIVCAVAVCQIRKKGENSNIQGGTSVSTLSETDVIETYIDKDLTSILTVNPSIITSSNPYDYIEMNKRYYDEIVSFGMEAVIAIDKIINKREASLASYIAALAVLDITKVDLYSITGVDWETSDEFWTTWEKMLEDMPDKLTKAVEDNDNVEKTLYEYGIFGETFANAIVESQGEEIEFAGQDIKLDISDEMKTTLEKAIVDNKAEITKAEQYINSSIEILSRD